MSPSEPEPLAAHVHRVRGCLTDCNSRIRSRTTQTSWIAVTIPPAKLVWYVRDRYPSGSTGRTVLVAWTFWLDVDAGTLARQARHFLCCGDTGTGLRGPLVNTNLDHLRYWSRGQVTRVTTAEMPPRSMARRSSLVCAGAGASDPCGISFEDQLLLRHQTIIDLQR